MIEELKGILLMALDNARSRKFLLTVAFLGVVVANRLYEWDISDTHLSTGFGVVIVYLLIEGITDFVERQK